MGSSGINESTFFFFFFFFFFRSGNIFPPTRGYKDRTQVAVYRFLLSFRLFLFSQLARLLPPLVWLNLCPLPRPRELLPAAVRPRSSLCFWTAAHIQLILGSRVMAPCPC